MNRWITFFVATATLALLNAAPSQSAWGFEPVKSKLIRVGTPAQELTVELDGAQDLYLYVDYGGDSYDFDQAIWANPVLIDENGAEVDLTTITPEDSKTGWGTLLVGKNHMGETLRIGKNVYERGFWAHAPSLLHFKLDGSYQRFKASVGLDSHAQRGSVVFHVLDKPVEYPSTEEYSHVDASVKAQLIPASKDSTFTFSREGAEKLLEEGVEELIFLRHYTYNSNHVYTDHVNCDWLPGAGFCILDLKTGETRDLLFDELKGGMIQRFDLSYDADKIVFDFRASVEEGYSIYEANLDGTGLKRLTFPVPEEKELHAKYRRGNYMHGTDDMHPCYLPDGGIAFISTRPQFSVLCDSSDGFTVTNLYRMDADGGNCQPLTFSALNEQSPAVLPDGRIIYHRWEYVDKAAGNAKALWAINPDGSGAAEVYGDNISFPESMMYPRPIPYSSNKIVFLGASHCCPNNAFGTVIVIDAKEDARSIETMKYITNDVRTYHHNGFHFLNEETGEYEFDLTGVPGRLFKDPYPISEELFIASRKEAGLGWSDWTAYDLVLLDENGSETPLLSDESSSCWHAVPIMERDVPPVRASALDDELASQDRAICAITNVYAGMEDVERGTVKYIRVLEQIPRSWSARKSWGDDHEGTTHTHSAVAHGALSVKVQLGGAPVEEDGSACFYVPADRAIYFQALDERFRAIQTERTYVNYRPGETRACVGCHETQRDAPTVANPSTPLAMMRAPSELQPQPNAATAEIAFDYDRQIQPIWDKHCVQCHDGGEEASAPDLRGAPQGNFSVSYWNLVRLGETEKQTLGGRTPRNEDAASAGIEYVPAWQTGALSSPLGAWLFGETSLKDAPEGANRALEELIAKHQDAGIELTESELIWIANWLDVNAYYHPSYFGRLHAKFQDRPDYRPEISPEEARSRTLPERIKTLYELGGK
ncbi:MAG: NPCBM/NEW2 domain-containing protein [Thermoguttaceae bacterium]|jgi:hypothetical protein